MAIPTFEIPESTSVVDIHIINSTSKIRGLPTELFMEPKIKGYDVIDCPAYSFLIEHPKNKERIVFDLGVRKDWENLAPSIANRIRDKGWSVEVDRGVADILSDGGVEPKSVDAIIWSHHHWDHTGDPSTFPHSTDLVVGPGFKDAFVPAYPTSKNAPVRESDYANRKLREISFDTGLQIGACNAFDYFGDGSFYLLDSPGHAIGHMCGLARTTPSPHSTFILLGGDCAHHAGEFRPSPSLPLPSTISPSPLPHLHPNVCPGSLFIPIHRLYDPSNRTSASDTPVSEPFFQCAAGGAHDVQKAQASVNKMASFDGREDVFVVIAHDAHVKDVVTLFPKGKANAWREEGWKEKVRWRFLGDFEEAVKERESVGRG
ncbi:MAG: hypothetical protein Q9220_003149 [cf. Caloplaca sp. 1 TL-2023]